MMIRLLKYQENVVSQGWPRSLSVQAVVSFKPSDDEYANAVPFDEIPGLNRFQVMKRFLPGGKFHGASVIDIQSMMRNEFGDLYRMPGLFGQNSVLTTVNAEDVEFIHRNEGIYPYRRGLETMKHFRENLRSDVYSAGGLIIE